MLQDKLAAGVWNGGTSWSFLLLEADLEQLINRLCAAGCWSGGRAEPPAAEPDLEQLINRPRVLQVAGVGDQLSLQLQNRFLNRWLTDHVVQVAGVGDELSQQLGNGFLNSWLTDNVLQVAGVGDELSLQLGNWFLNSWLTLSPMAPFVPPLSDSPRSDWT